MAMHTNIVREIQFQAETARSGDTMPLRRACELYLPDVKAFDRVMSAIRPHATTEGVRLAAGREAGLILNGK